MKKLFSWRVLRDSRRHQYWRAVLVGLGAGVVALLFQKSLEVAEGIRSALLTHLHVTSPAWGWLILPVIAGGVGILVNWATTRFAPNAAGSGIPHVKGVLTYVKTISWARILPVKFLGGLLCIGSGFSLGREGPTVQMGAAMGKLVSDVLRVPPKAAPRLMACGAGAGLTAAFHAPLAGFIFTIEELQREFSSLTYSMALIAAVVADIVATSFWGSGSVFQTPGFPAASLAALPVCVIIGLMAGLLGAGFNKTLLSVQDQCRHRWKTPPWLRAGLIGVIVGLTAWWLPQAAGGGHDITQSILRGGFAGSTSARFLLILFAGKFVLTALSYMAGVPGGIFAPMLVMGASIGLLSGIAASSIAPSVAPAPESFASIGMAAFFSAVVRAPLTGIVLVLEMTGDYRQLLPLLTSSMTAYVLSGRLGITPVYDALLAHDLHRKEPDIPAHREPVLLEFVVQEDSPMDGKCIKDIPIPERCLFVTIRRHGDDILPNGDTVVRRGDHVTAVLSGASASDGLTRILSLSKV